MKHRLMDLLACPVEKGWPLKLEILKESKEKEELDIPLVN
ncbi:MAG: Trm112 family protein, partial [Candidatus Heimdallarchaeaceae archaeon]